MSWRIVRFKDNIDFPEIKLKGRNKEKWQAILKIASLVSIDLYEKMYNRVLDLTTEVLREAQETLQGRLCLAVVNQVNVSKKLEFTLEEIFVQLMSVVEGTRNQYDQAKMLTEDLGYVTKDRIGKMLTNMFGSKTKLLWRIDRPVRGRIIDQKTLSRLSKRYNYNLTGLTALTGPRGYMDHLLKEQSSPNPQIIEN